MKIVVAFYANINFGSDWRVGKEYINFAARNGFNTAIIADLDRNSSGPELVPPRFGLNVLHVPTITKSHRVLLKYTDFLPQVIWHFRVAREIRRRFGHVECIWISTSSAQPWFPLAIYLPLAVRVIWGPAGGGGCPPWRVFKRLGAYAQIREATRAVVDWVMCKAKVRLFRKQPEKKIVILARTREMQKRLSTELQRSDIPLFPEFLQLMKPVRFTYDTILNPRFVWAGQDIVRKDLEFGLTLFRELRRLHFPQASLDVYGCIREKADDGIKFHGWVESVNWNEYKGNGVLLLSSFREGLSTVLIEAASHGLFCVATPVGAIPSINMPNVFVLPEEDHGFLRLTTLQTIAESIKTHIRQGCCNINRLSFEEELRDFLNAKGIISKQSKDK